MPLASTSSASAPAATVAPAKLPAADSLPPPAERQNSGAAPARGTTTSGRQSPSRSVASSDGTSALT